VLWSDAVIKNINIIAVFTINSDGYMSAPSKARLIVLLN
jgi:hypothetical protein